jgi:hypothetical protein
MPHIEIMKFCQNHWCNWVSTFPGAPGQHLGCMMSRQRVHSYRSGGVLAYSTHSAAHITQAEFCWIRIRIGLGFKWEKSVFQERKMQKFHLNGELTGFSLESEWPS